MAKDGGLAINDNAMGDGETILIGDIHGCLKEFLELLDRLSPTSSDRIILMGDLVNKGPDPGGVIEKVRELNCLCLRGNHDADHLKWNTVEGFTPKHDTITTKEITPPGTYAAYLEMIRHMPFYFEDESFMAIHAALLPDLMLKDQPEEILTGELTLDNSWKDTIQTALPLVVGHKRYSSDQSVPFIVEGKFYGIDTGCVYGGTLTALSLPSGRITQVRAGKVYAEEKRQADAV